MNERLRQELVTMRSFKIPELKELLSVQTLFNVGISQVASRGAYRLLLRSYTLYSMVVLPMTYLL